MADANGNEASTLEDVAGTSGPATSQRGRRRTGDTVTTAPAGEVKVSFKPATPSPMPTEIGAGASGAPGDLGPSALEVLVGASDQITVERLEPEWQDGVHVWTGQCGKVDATSSDLSREISARWGGGIYKLSGKVKGRVVTVPDFKIPGKAKPIAPPDNPDTDAPSSSLPPPQIAARPGFASYGQQPQPFPAVSPFPSAPSLPPAILQSQEVRALQEQLKQSELRAQKIEDERARERDRSVFMSMIEKLEAKINSGPREDPAKSILEAARLQAQADADRRREDAREERVRRDAEDARREAERKEERERREAERRDERERRDREEARLAAERKEDRERQEKLMAGILEKADPVKSLAALAEVQKTLGGSSRGGLLDFAREGREIAEIFGGGGVGPKSEAAEKIEATEKLVAGVSNAIGGVIRDVAPSLAEAWAIYQGKTNPGEAAPPQRPQVRARVQQPRPQQLPQAQRAASSPGFGPPQSLPQPVSADAASGTEEDDEDETPEEAKERESMEQAERLLKVIKFFVRLKERGNTPAAAADALRIFAVGAEAEGELGSLSVTSFEVIKAQLTVASSQFTGETKEVSDSALKLISTAEGEKWARDVLALLAPKQ